MIQLPLSPDAQAGPPAPDAVCAIGKMVAATSAFYFDVNGDGVWSGNTGGDRSATVNVPAGPGTLFVGDWNGDGWDDPGKLVGTTFSVDLNGNGVWNENAGGDRAASFATAAGPGVPVIGDWDGDSDSDIGIYSSGSWFLRDLNGNGVWDGDVLWGAQPGGDANGFILFPFGGTPIVADWSGVSKTSLGKYVDTSFYIDLNGDGRWSTNGGGDRARSFATFLGAGIPLAGDWNGDGGDEVGTYIPASGVFLLDLDGNGRWDGAPNDVSITFAAFAGPGTPLICDWDGDDDDDIGLVVGTKYYIDLNGNGVWNGNAGGDRVTDFKFGGVGTPIAGEWLPY